MFSAEALSFRQQSRLAISLSWVGGFTNVFAFLTFKTFASHMTGASTLLGMYTGKGSAPGVILYGVLVFAFVAGAMSSALMLETARRRGVRSKYSLPLTIEAFLLTILVVTLRRDLDISSTAIQCALLGLIAYAMGLQNATITKISGAVVRSTHLTGVLTDFGIESVQLLMWAFDQLRGRWWQRRASPPSLPTPSHTSAHRAPRQHLGLFRLRHHRRNTLIRTLQRPRPPRSNHLSRGDGSHSIKAAHRRHPGTRRPLRSRTQTSRNRPFAPPTRTRPLPPDPRPPPPFPCPQLQLLD